MFLSNCVGGRNNGDIFCSAPLQRVDAAEGGGACSQHIVHQQYGEIDSRFRRVGAAQISLPVLPGKRGLRLGSVVPPGQKLAAGKPQFPGKGFRQQFPMVDAALASPAGRHCNPGYHCFRGQCQQSGYRMEQGSQFIREFAEHGDEKQMQQAIDGALRGTFRPEFLNRIDDTVIFNALSLGSIEPIVNLQLEDVRARLAERRIHLVVTPAAMQQLSLDGYDPVFGARPLKRLIQKEIVDRIANEMVRGNVMEGAKVTIDLNDELRYAATVENPDPEPPRLEA